MGEPKAITYKEVKKANETNALENWRKIGDITGAGHVALDADEDASIDITGLAEGKLAQINKLLGKEESAEPEPTKSTKKEGTK